MNARYLNHRGSTLIYSLLTMMIIVAISSAVGTLTVRSIQETRTGTDAVRAYYAADAALEAGLFIMAENRFAGNISLATTITDITDKAAAWANTSRLVSGLESEIQSVKESVDKVETALEENETLQLDFVDPDAVAINLQDINLNWKFAEDLSRIEVTWTGWNKNGGFTSNSESFQFLISGTGSGSKIVNVRQVQNLEFHRVRIKVMKGSVQGLTVTARDNTGSDLDVPMQVFITAKGKYGNSSQATAAIAPWNVPSSALGDFVLFSDDELIKEFAPCDVFDC